MNLNITIHNEEDIDYLKTMDENKMNKIVETAISIGLKSIHMSEVKLDCHSYVDPIKTIVTESNEEHKERLELIETKLDDLLHIKTNSSRKGKLSEDICRHVLIKQYPSWNIIDVSQTGYEADCRAVETPIGAILYEFKNYDYNVNKDQITKFIRDLEHTNIKYGIFVSNTSGIVGKKNIEWEIIDNKLIVFVSNMGLNGYGCIIGTELLLSLAEINVMDKDKNWIHSNNYDLKYIIENISDSIDSLKNNIESYTKHKVLISEQRIKINSCIDILEKNSFMCLLELNDTFKKIINDTKGITYQNKLIHTNDLDVVIQKIQSEKNKSLMSTFIKLCSNFIICTDNTNILIYNKDKLICHTNILKTRIDLLFPLYGTNVNLNITYEKIKGHEIVIELKDEIEILNVIETRLNE